MSGYDLNQRGQNDGFGSGSGNEAGSPSNPPSPTQRDAAIRQSVLQQMTEKERQALNAVREKVTVMRRLGAIGGAVVTYGLLSRRKPLPALGARVGLTILGSIAGGGVMMPLGVFWARKDMQNVEDPKHFAKVLQGAADERTGRIAPGVSQGMAGSSQQRQQQMQSGTAGPSSDSPYPNFPAEQTQSTRRSPSSSQNGASNQWGDDSFDDSILYGSQSQSASYPSNANQTFNDSGISSSQAGPTAHQTTPQQSQQPSSRWAQIRGDRTTQASSWDRLRQQNAQEVYQRRNAGSGSNVDEGVVKGDSMADPSFGKEMSPARAQAQREYEASFDRERRGIDG